MRPQSAKMCTTVLPRLYVAAVCLCLPAMSMGQASPFETGANSLVDTFITLATPIAILAVMALGIAAIAGRISWAWPLCAVLGIVIIFGAETLVTWIRGMFGV